MTSQVPIPELDHDPFSNFIVARIRLGPLGVSPSACSSSSLCTADVILRFTLFFLAALAEPGVEADSSKLTLSGMTF
jgi:hypothetical protein